MAFDQDDLRSTSTYIKKFDSLIRSVDRVFPMGKTFSSMANYQRSIIAFKAIKNLCPTYLSERFKLVASRHSYFTRGAANNNLIVQNSANGFSDRTFLRQSTTIWNRLPASMKLTDSILKFKSLARNHFF